MYIWHKWHKSDQSVKKTVIAKELRHEPHNNGTTMMPPLPVLESNGWMDGCWCLQEEDVIFPPAATTAARNGLSSRHRLIVNFITATLIVEMLFFLSATIYFLDRRRTTWSLVISWLIKQACQGRL